MRLIVAPTRVLVVLVATFAVAATVSAPAVVAAPAVPALAGTTEIRASRPVSVDVRLPRAATVATPFADSPDLTVRGNGRIVGFALVGTDRSTAEVRLVGGADGAGTRFLMRAGRFDSGSYGAAKTYPDTATLPAGRYRLHVVPDGAPVTFTLRLRGLAGRVALAPSRRARAEVLPGDGVTTAGAQAVYTGTVAYDLDREGIAVHLLRGRVEASAAWEVVLCHGRGDTVRPMPACPTGKGHAVGGHRGPEAAPAPKQWVQVLGWVPPDTHHLSGTFTGAAYATGVEYVSLWLTL